MNECVFRHESAIPATYNLERRGFVGNAIGGGESA
jgi:hypothetical protein